MERAVTGHSKENRHFGEIKTTHCSSFRKLNDLTIGDSFPLPNITDILDQLKNAKYFSTLDLALGFHQISMHEEHRNKTVFSTPYAIQQNAVWIEKRTGNVSTTD